MNANSDSTSSPRQPAVAGQFYPGNSSDLQAAVSQFLQQAEPVTPAPKAIVAPHAGYMFSGAVAGSAYAGWQDLGTAVQRVVLLGPAHRFYLRGMAVPAARQFLTPLGAVDVDQEAVTELANRPDVTVDDRPHADEHSLEVQLPFLQVLFPKFTLVPIVVGVCSGESVAAVLEQLWGADDTRIVISSDLSHYHSYYDAREIDAATSAAICALQAEAIGPEQACGCMPLRGLMTYARDHGLQISELDRRNSGDTAGPRDRVVGYGAYAIQTST